MAFGRGVVIGVVQLIGEIVRIGVPRQFRQVDDRFQRLDLTEKQFALALRPLPIFQQPARNKTDAGIVRASPGRDFGAEVVNQPVLCGLILLLVFQIKLPAALFGLGNGDKIDAFAAARHDFIRNAGVGKAKMPLRFGKG